MLLYICDTYKAAAEKTVSWSLPKQSLIVAHFDLLNGMLQIIFAVR